MLREVKFFLNKIRGFLNENANTSTFVEAINNRKYLYIYYSGDDTIMTGYRIIKPYVIGATGAGNTVLRAWETEGNSDSFYGLSRTRRKDHEYFYSDGKEVPGWRLFRVDKITSVYPTGRSFRNEPLPRLYNPNDKQMVGGIIASVEKTQKRVDVKDKSKLDDPSVVKYKGGKDREVTKKDIEELYDLVRKVKKRRPSDYVVYYDENDDLNVVTEKTKHRVPEENIVGNLRELYLSMVQPKRPDDRFHKQKRSELEREIGK